MAGPQGTPPRLKLIEPAPPPERDATAAHYRALELAGLGTGLVLTTVLMAWMPSWRSELGTFQSLYVVAFAFFALALLRGLRGVAPPHAASLVVVVAVAARLALLPVVPSLSDDVYRYVWEGRVVASGGNPYRSSPADPAWSHLRDREVHPRINHPELATIYPPAAMAGFTLVAAVSPTVGAMKLWIMLHDLALVLLLVRALQRRGANPLAAIAYAWNPLVLVEYAGSGHHDPTGMVFLVAAVAWAERRPALSSMAWALACLVKILPLVALPFLWGRWTARARVIALALLVPAGAWFWFETRGPTSGPAAFWRTWENNDLLFPLLEQATGGFRSAQAIALAIVAVVVVVLMSRRAGPAAGTQAAFGAGLLVSPVAHPWYFGWGLALEPLVGAGPRPLGVAWLLLSLTAILSYGLFVSPAEGGGFHLPLAWRWVEYGMPLAAALAVAMAGRTRSAHHT